MMRGEPNESSSFSMATSFTTTVAMEMMRMTEGGNLSLVWRQSEVLSISERARMVLSQPVAIISMTLCALSLVANLLSITATLLGPHGLVTHLKLVVSLGLSDMLLSVSTVSHVLNRIFNTVPRLSTPPEQRLTFACASTFHFALHTMAIVISLLNLLAMALDHYVAIMNPLHYPTVLSRAKGTLLICSIWLVAFVGGCSVFFADVSQFRKVSRYLNYCEFVQYADYQGEYLVFAIALVSLFVITYTYGRIYVEVRRTYRHGSSNPMDYVRNRKALLTTLLIIGTFVFCWLPTCLFQIALLIQVQVDKPTVQRLYATFLRANRYLNALLLFNSLCDPIIYAFRLRDVQLGYRRLFRKCFFRRQKRHNSFRSSVMRQTQTAQLPPLDTVQSSSGADPDPDPDPPCNSLALCCDDDLGKGDVEAEVTPMIVYTAANGAAVCHVCGGCPESKAVSWKVADTANGPRGACGRPSGGGKFPNSLCNACNVGSSSPDTVSQV